MTVLAQIVKLIPAKIIDSLAKKYKIQTRAFSPTSHVVTLLYEHLAHSLSLNDVCDSLQHYSGMLNQIRRCTPPTRNGLSYANRNRNADMMVYEVMGQHLKRPYNRKKIRRVLKESNLL